MKGAGVRTGPAAGVALLLCGLVAASWGQPAPDDTAPPGLEVRNGWLVQDGRAVWGWVQHNGWWRAGQRPNLARRSVGDPLGDVRPNRTENLDELTSAMVAFGYPGFEHNYGLWYDRRRDAHDEAPRGDPDVQPPFLEQPWARSDRGRASDGLPLYDLSRFNDWYFARLEQFADLCGRKGAVLLHKYYMQHALLEIQPHYADFAWRPGNCVQQTGMPDRIPAASAFYDVSHPVRRELHRAYIRRCLESLGGRPNVIHLVGQEYTGPREFVEFWLDTLMEWERETGQDLLIGLDATKDVQDAILADPVRRRALSLLDLRYWWVAADGALHAEPGGREVPGRFLECGFEQGEGSSPERIYHKVREYREHCPELAIVDALAQDRQQSWALLMGGGSLVVAGQIEYTNHSDPLAYERPANLEIIAPTYQFIREHLATALPLMRPLDVVAGAPEDVWCLGAPGVGYLVYALRGGSFRLELPEAPGALRARWLDVRNGALPDAGIVAPGRATGFRAPDRQDWALWLEPFEG